MTKVKINYTLIGRAHKRKKEVDERTNAERLDDVLKVVKGQFGDRPVYVLDGNSLAEEKRKYPEYFAAGWFLGEGLASAQNTSELVVVGHGNSMEDARKFLMNAVKTVDWQNLAKDV